MSQYAPSPLCARNYCEMEIST